MEYYYVYGNSCWGNESDTITQNATLSGKIYGIVIYNAISLGRIYRLALYKMQLFW